MRKKYMLCGALQGETGNFGDDLLRIILINNLKKYNKHIEIIDYDSDTSLQDFIQSDLFIYIPGGYMGYIEKWYSGGFRKTFQRFIYYYWPGLKAVFLKKKIVILAAGIGPYEYPILGKILGIIAQNAKLITVRDRMGKALLEKHGVKKRIYVTADTAQTLCGHGFIDYDFSERKLIEEKFKGKRIILIHYIGIDDYLDKVYKALKKLFFSDEQVSFVIGTDWPGRCSPAIKFANKFPKNRCYTYNYKSVKQMINIIDSVDCVITGKFHVGIVGCTLSKSVINFSVQYAKASLYYNQIGYSDRCHDVFTISEQQVENLIKRYYKEQVIINEKIIQKAQSNYDIFLKKIITKNV